MRGEEELRKEERVRGVKELKEAENCGGIKRLLKKKKKKKNFSTTTLWHNIFHNLMTCVTVIGEPSLSYRPTTFSLPFTITQDCGKKNCPYNFYKNKIKTNGSIIRGLGFYI